MKIRDRHTLGNRTISLQLFWRKTVIITRFVPAMDRGGVSLCEGSCSNRRIYATAWGLCLVCIFCICGFRVLFLYIYPSPCCYETETIKLTLACDFYRPWEKKTLRRRLVYLCIYTLKPESTHPLT